MERLETKPQYSLDSQSARYLFPRAELSSLIFAAIIRDTRGIQMESKDRFNCFPASPLCAITWVREGRLHLADSKGCVDPTALQSIFVTGASSRPLISWSPGSVLAMTVGFYPDALRAMAGVDVAAVSDRIVPLGQVFTGSFQKVLSAVGETNDFSSAFAQLESDLELRRRNTRSEEAATQKSLNEWTLALGTHAAISGVGSRQIQRAIKARTGKNMRELKKHARVESLFAQSRKHNGKSLAQIAADEGYADQSHMGREVRLITGASPAKIRRMIATDKRYWFYRAVSEYFHDFEPTE